MLEQLGRTEPSRVQGLQREKSQSVVLHRGKGGAVPCERAGSVDLDLLVGREDVVFLAK